MNRRQKLVQQQFLNNEEAVIKRLNQVYGVALNDINGKIEALMKRFDPVTGDLPQSVIYQIKYQQMLKGQVEGILQELQTKGFLTVSEYLDTCYEDGFVGALFDLHGQGVPMAMPINQESMVKAVQLDSKISQGMYTRLGEDVDLLKKKITAQVSRSIATGVSFEQTAKQLAGYTRIGYNNAIRIARTEGHRIQCSATHDAAQQAIDRGADVVKVWDSTLDGKTRESHVALDRQIREVDKPFSNGLMYPGDSVGEAAEVINCRCGYLQKARRWLDGSFTKVNNFTGQIETFNSPQEYEDFKKGFFSPENKQFMNYAQKLEERYKTKDWNKILSQMTDQEYKHYSRLLANSPMYNLGGSVMPSFTPAKTMAEARDVARQWAKDVSFTGATNLDAINEVNRALQTLQDKCPIDELSYIKTNGRLTRAEARANYHDIEINTKWLNDAGNHQPYDWAARVARNQQKIAQYIGYTDPTKYPPSTVKTYRKYIRQLEDECRYTRWTVSSGDVFGTIVHEYGHVLADQYFGQINGVHANGHFSQNSNNPLWVQKQYVAGVFNTAKKNGDIHNISMYAASDEYEFFAETFSMYITGEPLPDYIEDMVKKVISDGKL